MNTAVCLVYDKKSLRGDVIRVQTYFPGKKAVHTKKAL